MPELDAGRKILLGDIARVPYEEVEEEASVEEASVIVEDRSSRWVSASLAD